MNLNLLSSYAAARSILQIRLAKKWNGENRVSEVRGARPSLFNTGFTQYGRTLTIAAGAS